MLCVVLDKSQCRSLAELVGNGPRAEIKAVPHVEFRFWIFFFFKKKNIITK